MTKLFREFISRITSEFNVSKVTIYSYDGHDTSYIIGERLTNAVLEDYLSHSGTTVIKQKDSSRLVSRISTKNEIYMIMLHSPSRDTFRDTEVQFIIADLQKLERRIRSEYCSSSG